MNYVFQSKQWNEETCFGSLEPALYFLFHKFKMKTKPDNLR